MELEPPCAGADELCPRGALSKKMCPGSAKLTTWAACRRFYVFVALALVANPVLDQHFVAGFSDRCRFCGYHGGPLRAPRPARAGGGTAVTAVNLAGLVVAAGLLVFLVVALLFPERF